MAKTRSADRQRYWREVIERQRTSEQSIVGFCTKEGLAPASFHAWKRRLRQRRSTEQNAAFLPVQIVDGAQAGTGKLAVRWPDGTVLQRVLQSAIVNADETEVKMLKPGHGKTIKGYLNGFVGDAEHRYVFYDFRPSRSRDGPAEVLADYQGYLQTDGYVVYTSLVKHSAGRLADVACWAGARSARVRFRLAAAVTA